MSRVTARLPHPTVAYGYLEVEGSTVPELLAMLEEVKQKFPEFSGAGAVTGTEAPSDGPVNATATPAPEPPLSKDEEARRYEELKTELNTELSPLERAKAMTKGGK